MALSDVNQCRALPQYFAVHLGQALLLTDLKGRIGEGQEGFYVGRTRFLSRWCFKVQGEEPEFISANPVEPHTLIAYHMAPSPAGKAAAPQPPAPTSEVAAKAIGLTQWWFVGGGLRHEIAVTNHGLAPVRLTLSWEIAADFAGQSEAQSGRREQNAPVERQWTEDRCGGRLALRYCHPELDHHTVLAFSGAAFVDKAGSVSCGFALAPQETATLAVDLAVIFSGRRIEPFFGKEGALRGDAAGRWTRDEWGEGCTRLTAANPLVQAAWDRAASDLASLHLLEGEDEQRFTPAAGVPNYLGLFGRDALMAAWQSTLLNPATLRGTLRHLVRWNAVTYDDFYDAEPGKVLHQRQVDPPALLGHTPFVHYYGDYSAPALFLIDIATAFAVSGDRDFFRTIRDAALATLAWMERDGDRDRDGFYEYATRSKMGLKNQGWKDSGEAILYPDGRMVENPIAVCEIQALYFAAKQAMAVAFSANGEGERAARLLAEAEALKRRFNAAFWLPEEDFFALALDPDKRPVRTIASNPCACLAYGIAEPDKAAAVARRLMADDLYSGWGVRTLSAAHPAYNPFAYHLGSVWPSPNAVIGFGLKRYGFDAALHRLAKGIFDLSAAFELNRLPEAVGGHQRGRRYPHPGLYPGACAPQAWSAGAIILFVHTMLGLVPLVPAGVVVVDPDLPEWLPEVTIRDLRLGQHRLSMRFRRTGPGRTAHEVLDITKGLRVLRLPQCDEGAAPEDRLVAAVMAAVV